MPKPQVLESGKDSTLPSREQSRKISTRTFYPESGTPKGVFLHIHGGGWVLQTEAYQDIMLQEYASSGSLIVISVGYRLAPENPYPAGNEDCFDAGEYLVDNAEKEYGVPLMFIGGDSAGGHLSVLTAFKLLETRPAWKAKGLVLNFGAFDLSGFLPQVFVSSVIPLSCFLADLERLGQVAFRPEIGPGCGHHAKVHKAPLSSFYMECQLTSI